MKLYRSVQYPDRWYACSIATGWVMFPAIESGWEKREPARGIDPITIRQVPLHLAANTGITDAPAASASLSEAA